MTEGKIGLYRVFARLESPMIWHRGLNLDALCVAAIMQNDGEVPTRQSPNVPALPHIPVPRVAHHGQAVYLSSDAMLPAGTRFERVHWVRRKDAQDINRLTRPFNRAGGPDRDAMKSGRLALTETVAWQLWTKYPNWLIDLLTERIQSLGGLRSHGYGRVAEWRIKLVDVGHPELAWVEEGVTLRALPVDWLQIPVMPTRLSVRPPYWHQSSLAMAAPVGSQSELTNEVIQLLNSDRFLKRKPKPPASETPDVEQRQVMPRGWL